MDVLDRMRGRMKTRIMTDVDRQDFKGLEGELETLVAKLRRAIENAGGRQGKQRETRFSIKRMPDGTHYVNVDVDQQLFDGLTVNEMQKKARQVILERFRGKVIGAENRAYVDRKSADEYTYPANRRIEPQIKADKLRASTELDHLMEVSQFVEHTGDDGRHPDAVGGWDKYRTLFQVGTCMYEGIISVKNTANGNVFYDLTKMKDVTASNTANMQNFARAISETMPSSDKTISQSGVESNSQISESGGKDGTPPPPLGAVVAGGGLPFLQPQAAATPPARITDLERLAANSAESATNAQSGGVPFLRAPEATEEGEASNNAAAQAERITDLESLVAGAREAGVLPQGLKTDAAGLANAGESGIIGTIAAKPLPKIFGIHSQALPQTANVDFGEVQGVVPKGAPVENVRVIAGMGTSTQLRDAPRLKALYGGSLTDWQKITGTVYGDSYKYEVHWYECRGNVPIETAKTIRVWKI
jgi:hypothetical protein